MWRRRSRSAGRRRMRKRRRRGGTRSRRGRPTPKWLLSSEQIDRVAKARCLMLLSVLSGEKPVTDAITEAGISRGTYYQLETRGLNGMLKALGPLGGESPGEDAKALRRIAELESKVRRLEAAKRRSQRLLLMTRRVVKGGVTLRVRIGSTRSGQSHLPSSKRGAEAQLLTPGVTGEARP